MVHIVFLSYSIALNLHVSFIRLTSLPNFDLFGILLTVLLSRTKTRLARIRRFLNSVLLIIVKLQFVGFSVLRDPRSNIKSDIFKRRSLLDILRVIPRFLFTSCSSLSLRSKVYVCFVGENDIVPETKDRIVYMLRTVNGTLLTICR